jgi:hypothetical protein
VKALALLAAFAALSATGCNLGEERAARGKVDAERRASHQRAQCDVPCSGEEVTCASLRELAGTTGFPTLARAYVDAFAIEVTSAEYDAGLACDDELLLGWVAPGCVPRTPRMRVCGNIGWSDPNSDDDVGGGPRQMYPIRIDPVR